MRAPNRTTNAHWAKVDRASAARKFDHLKQFLPHDFESVLDLAAGPGMLHDSIAQWKDHRYTMVESSTEAVRQAEDLGLTAVLFDIDAGPLPFPDNSFDLVIATHILEHLRNPWAVLAEMRRVSRKYVFVECPNFAWWRCRWDVLRGQPPRHMIMDKDGSVMDARGRHLDHIYFMTYRNCKHWMERLGMRTSSQVFWYRRFALFRWFLNPLFKNWGEAFEMLGVKNPAYTVPEDPNFRFEY